MLVMIRLPQLCSFRISFKKERNHEIKKINEKKFPFFLFPYLHHVSTVEKERKKK